MNQFMKIRIAFGVGLFMTDCAGMSLQDKSTAVGAGIGAVGGVIGHEVSD